MAKAKGNAKLAERYVPSKRESKSRATPQHILDYHSARNAQDRRFEAHVGGGIAAEDTHTREYKDYFGVGDHSTSGAIEQRITFKSHMQERAAMRAEDAGHQHSYDHGFHLGQQHASQQLDTATENHQYDRGAASVIHEADFGQGYGDGLAATYDAVSAGKVGPIHNRRDVAAALLALPNAPRAKQAALARRIKQRAAALGATDLLPKAA
jgi:hypothetical protein